MTAHIRKEASTEQIRIATDMFKLVSDPSRLKILWTLLHGEHSVGELADEVGVSQTVVSQHLAKLRTSHLVSARRESTKMFYSAENEHVLKLIEYAFTQADHIRSGEHE